MQFCVMQYLNDARYFTSYTTPNSGKYQNLRQNNVKFLQSKSPSLTTIFVILRTLGIQTLRSRFLRMHLPVIMLLSTRLTIWDENIKRGPIRKHYYVGL